MSKREKVHLVDKSDNVIGEKWRDELMDKDCWRVIAVWVVNEENKILLQQRSFKKKIGPGIWSAACEGTIEVGASPVETAVRELSEEIGITVKQSDLQPTAKVHYKDPQFGWRIKYGFILKIQNRPIETFSLQLEEVEQVKWFSFEELEEFYHASPDKFPLYSQYKQLLFY